MSSDKNGPYRADHVGSFLRPARLMAARSDYAQKTITHDQLHAVEDDCIRDVIKMQEDAGIHAVTDGEFRRFMFHIDFLEKIKGITKTEGFKSGFSGGDSDHDDFTPAVFETTGKLSHAEDIHVDDFKFVRDNTKATAKLTIPSPTFAYARGGRAAISEKAYPDLETFFDDLTQVYREEIASLAKAGCRYVQMDETNFAFLCDPKLAQAFRDRGDDPDDLVALYIRLINDSIRDRPSTMSASIHLCRGNYRSGWVADGGYDPIAERMFNEVAVDGFFLEYDDERSGTFEPLRFVPKGKTVVLGLVTSKRAELESAEELKRRIGNASRYLGLDQLALSPQCGFASSVHGNRVTVDVEKAKLALIVDVATSVWGTAV